MKKHNPYFKETAFFVVAGLAFVIVMAYRTIKYPGFPQ